MTYHDACRLNKRKGIHEAPREILRAIPGIDVKDVDHVTQWSYCSGAGGGLAIERPDLTAEISRRRVEKANALGVDTSSAPASGPSARSPSRAEAAAARGDGPDGVGREAAGRRPGRSAMTARLVTDPVIDELVAICGADHVFTEKSARVNRARVPAPFPVHRWSEHVPDVVVLPTSAEQISEVVKLANRYRIPVVPRAGGTGLTDGAVPLRHGILVDVKLMNRILELDLDDRTVTVQPGINMLKLNEELRSTASSIPTTRRRTPAPWSAAASAPAAGR